MSTDYDFTGIDEDLLLSGKDSYGPREGGGGGDGTAFWTMKANSVRTIYFHNDPWDDAADNTGHWFNYRAIYAQEGLAGGIELPGGLREFAVKDQIHERQPDGSIRRKEIPLSSPDADPLLQLVVPYLPRNSKLSQPYRPVSDKGAVCVVEIGENGEEWPKILVMTGPRMKELRKKLRDYREMVDGFTCVGKQWVLSVSGPFNDEEVDLRLVKGVPPIEMPEPHDIRELLTAQRLRILEIVQGETGVDVSDELADETMPYDGPDEPGASPKADKAEYYASMTDTRLKGLLSKAGVRVPRGTQREGLLALALDNNV